MIGFLLYIPTLIFVPVFLGYFTIFFVRKEKLIHSTRIDKNVLIISIIILLSLINKLIGYDSNSTFTNLIPETGLMLLMFWISKSINSNSIKVIIFLTFIELLAVILEYYLKINSFSSKIAVSYESNALLYDMRPFGLSNNSSVVSLKFFLCILIIFRFKLFPIKIKISLVLLFLIGIIMTFNRTIIIAVVIFLLLFLIKYFKNSKNLKIGLFLSTIVIFALIVFNIDVIMHQLTRGREGVDILSGRTYIWKEFLFFIQENIFFGNNSYKYYIDFYGKTAQAHNSYLQILATHGIFISAFFMVLIFQNLNKSNAIYVIPILIYSLTQYGIFWGFSITDVILYIFIFNKKIDYETLYKTF